MKVSFGIILIQFLIVFSGLCYGLELKLAVNQRMIYQDSRVIQTTRDIKQCTVYNLLDGNVETESITFIDKQNPYSSVFEIVFDQPYPVDKIVLVNGASKEADITGAKSVRFAANDSMVLVNKKVLEAQVYQNSFRFMVNKDRFEIPFDKAIDAYKWQFNIIDSLGREDSPFSIASISEIEFWYNDVKYKVLNLDELREAIKREWRSTCLNGLLRQYSWIKHSYFSQDKTDLLKVWKESGIPVDNLKVYTSSKLILDIEFITNQDFAGDILAGKTNGSITLDPKSPMDRPAYFFQDALVLGKWKMDEDGSLWILIGKGEWKLSRSSIDFRDTILSGILYTEDFKLTMK